MARYETKTQAGTTIALEWVPVESPPAGVVVNEVTGRPVCAQFLIRFPNGRAVPGAYLLLPPRTGDPDAQGPDHALERIKRAAEVCERAQDWIPPNATLIVGTTAPKVFIDTNADLRSPLWIAQTTERYQMHTILDYDFEPDANTISVTELVNNDVRAIALGRQMPFLPRDITELSAPIGQIMHRVAELPPLVVKDGANNVVVRVIPEQRLAVQIDGITLSGRPDAILEMPDGVVVVDTKTFPGQVYPTSIPKGWLEEHGAAHLADKRLIEIVHERPWLAQAWLLEWLENQRPTFFDQLTLYGHLAEGALGKKVKWYIVDMVSSSGASYSVYIPADEAAFWASPPFALDNDVEVFRQTANRIMASAKRPTVADLIAKAKRALQSAQLPPEEVINATESCKPEFTWQRQVDKPFALYSDATMTRAVKRFETEAEALQALYKKGQGVVVMDHEVPVKCARYCGVRYCCPVGQEARNASSRYLVKALGVQVDLPERPAPVVA